MQRQKDTNREGAGDEGRQGGEGREAIISARHRKEGAKVGRLGRLGRKVGRRLGGRLEGRRKVGKIG
jgi:hypothetical protein